MADEREEEEEEGARTEEVNVWSEDATLDLSLEQETASWRWRSVDLSSRVCGVVSPS